MKKLLLKSMAVAMTLTLVLALTSCSDDSASSAKPKKKKKEVTYESIYNEYDKKMAELAPKKVEEFNKESEGVTDVNKLAEISTKKIGDIALVNTQGAERMASLMQKKGDEYSTYEEWAMKLSDRYQEYSKQVTDAYMSKAQKVALK